MAKKKKKQTEGAPSARPQPFNNPFMGLKGALRETAPPAAPPAPEPEAAPPPPASPDEEALFAAAMADVARLGGDGPRSRRDQGAPAPHLPLAPDDDLEVMASLADLVAGGGEFDLAFSDEFVAGALPGVGPELLERLKAGAFPMQDYLDLHGLGAEEAAAELEAFLTDAATRGLRHVLVVHGRGRGSPGGVPVLKSALTSWLGTRKLGRRVLAFCTARQVDGGAGAMYLLLRHWSGPRATRW